MTTQTRTALETARTELAAALEKFRSAAEAVDAELVDDTDEDGCQREILGEQLSEMLEIAQSETLAGFATEEMTRAW